MKRWQPGEPSSLRKLRVPRGQGRKETHAENEGEATRATAELVKLQSGKQGEVG